MKRLIVGSLLLLCTAQLFADVQVSLGPNFSTSLNRFYSQSGNNNNNSTIRYNLAIGPELLIAINDQMEVVPFIDITYSRQSGYRNDDLVGLDRSWGYDAGCGIYFRLIKGDAFRFSIGPKFRYGQWFDPENTDNTTLTWELAAPANIDFLLSDRFFIRASPTIVGVQYDLTSTGQQDNYSGNFNFSAVTQSFLAIAFFFTF